MKKNDLFRVEIVDMGSEGEGIGKVDGFPFFIKDTLIGDVVEAKVTKLKKQYGYARLMEILTASPDRVEPKCPLHQKCGGCQLQALSYEKQLVFKENKIKNNLLRLGGLTAEQLRACMEPIVGMENPYHYRNKAQFPVGTDREGNLVTGFYAGRTHTIIPNTDCCLGVAENREILETILDFLKTYQIPAYEEATGRGLVRHILLRKGFATGELMVCLILNGRSLPHSRELVDRLGKISGMTSICLNVNERNTNVIMGEEILPLWGQNFITDKIGGISYQISPLSFYQVNPVQTEKLYRTALEFAGLTGRETVWDLYCGIGTISLFLAQGAKRVYGVEVVPQAIADARRNAERNGISNVEFFVGKAEEVLPEFYEKEQKERGQAARDMDTASQMRHPDVIVVDPPRKGCDERCLYTMLKMAPERIVYVSCDSATLGRDLKYLGNGGYVVTRVRGVDMFPGTGHVETVVMLSHKKPIA
ncbi:MAG: 23S rRNA (uracil(1939)-C(5))-methyltransferase RlmD [Lachnospiraceae bacterium]|nr:23S rRNA (uracil(1939)-C(5))-methyltransferase RlmD [Lachnospiraceae bacterium]